MTRRPAYLVCTRTADKIGDVDDLRAQLRRQIAIRHAAEQEIERLIKEARTSQEPPVSYNDLVEDTGLTREWLRRIVNGTAKQERTRRRSGDAT
jgi:hypothetical protein